MKPLAKCYNRLKRELPAGAELLIRRGGSYVTLTVYGSECRRVPVGKVSAAVAEYLGKGRAVALADYAETPRPGRFTRREVTRLFTPSPSTPSVPIS